MEMLEAVETFETVYDGASEVITAGRTRVAPGHELAERFPGRFRPVRSRGVADRSGTEYRAQDPRDGRSRRCSRPRTLLGCSAMRSTWSASAPSPATPITASRDGSSGHRPWGHSWRL